MIGYLPWIYINCYTFLDALRRILGKQGPELNYRNSKIFVRKAEKVIIFNLRKFYKIEMTEFRGAGKIKCPDVKYLLIIVAKSRNGIRVKTIFPKT